MSKPLKLSWLRVLVPVVFVLLAVAGTIWHLGWGTLSSFGWKQIAAVCPLGAVETMLAQGAILPRALVALLIFFVLAVVFGRFFCGWLCPVPPVSSLLHFIKNGGRRRDPAFFAAPAKTSGTACVAGASASTVAAPAPARSKAFSAASCGASRRVIRIVQEKKATSSAGPLTLLVGALASSAVFGFPVFCLVCPVGLTFGLVIALSRLFQFNEAAWSVLLFAGFLVLELVVLRRWCSRFCPLGALIGLMSRLNRFFVPRINPKACVHVTHGVDCRICLDACPEGIDLRQGPPSADQIARCIKCGQCARACPSKAVSFPWLGSMPFAAAAPLPERGTSGKLPVARRVRTYDEAKRTLPVEEAVRQSTRCLRCGRCTEICPQGNPVRQWMTSLSQGDVDGAARLMLGEGALPEICGRICPSERFCENVCSMQEAHGAVMIADIERSVAQYALDHGFKPAVRRARRPVKVAVIGAGPAGLACADFLARRGVRVALYESAHEIGGLLSYGIAPFKLDRRAVARRRTLLTDLGVTIRTDTRIGRDVDFETVRSQNDAVFVATGASRAVPLTVPGAELTGVLPAMTLLGAVCRRALGEAADVPALKGKRVVVLGGGDTAVDCLRCAVREGAAEAVAVARKKRELLRATPGEIAQAEEEGARFACGLAVLRLEGRDGRVTGVVCVDAKGVESTIAADAVIVAYGFTPAVDRVLERAGVTFDAAERIVVDEEGATAASGVFAGGDAARGSYVVAGAVCDGRAAAQAILRHCRLA